MLFRILALAGMYYSLLPIMFKIFDVICQLADDLYVKRIFFKTFVGFYPSKSLRDFSLLLLTICKLQFYVSGKIFFNIVDKNKSIVIVFFLISFGHTLLYE